jgi:LmbE family N-acetylglucosaminyl deacetylase
MIPLADEWLAGRVLVVAPHPDDESLAAGALLQRALALGGRVRLLFVTDGEANVWPQRFVERRWQIDAAVRSRWGARRRIEALRALMQLGVEGEDAVFLGAPDLGLTRRVGPEGSSLIERLAREIEAWKPSLLVAPSARDLHPDHSALAVLLRLALRRIDPPRRPRHELAYVVHGGAAVLPPLGLRVLRLSGEERWRKRRAILEHRSQVLLSRRRLLAHAGEREVFLCRELPRTEDERHPVASARWEAEGLRLWLAPRARLRAFGEASLRLATLSGGEPVLQRLPLPRRTRSLLVPSSLLPPGDEVYVKLERRFGFFDEAGWRALPPAPPTRTALRSRPLVCAVIPAFQVVGLCEPVVRGALFHADHVIVVDDGSSDGTGAVLAELVQASDGRLRLVVLPVNRGKGAALLAGFRCALEDVPFDVLVTLDADQQHRPGDIPRLVDAWSQERAALVIGERTDFTAMPLRSRIGNGAASALLRALHPGGPLDTQSGFRALDRRFLEEVLRCVKGRRYETELEILLLALRRGRAVARVPIPTLYLDGNTSSHFRPLQDTWRIARALAAAGREPAQRDAEPAAKGAAGRM